MGETESGAFRRPLTSVALCKPERQFGRDAGLHNKLSPKLVRQGP